MATATMSALVLSAPGRFEVREVPRPAARYGEVLVEVDLCGICGTDLRIVSGAYPIPTLPLVIGHEMAGRVVSVGSGVAHVRRGERVAVDPIAACGICRQCRRSRPALCEDLRELGINAPGGMADYVVARGQSVHRLPEHVRPREAALVEPIACAVHGQDQAQIGIGDEVAIVGGGLHGLLHTLLSRLRGATFIAVCARHSRRRARAKSLGADLVLDPDGNPAAELLAATGGHGVDVVIEASGSEQGYALAMEVVARGGRVVAYGATPGTACLRITPFDVHARELTVVGSFGGSADAWPRAVDLLAHRALDAAVLVDAEWELRDAPQAFEALARDRDIVKGMIRMTGEPWPDADRPVA